MVTNAYDQRIFLQKKGEVYSRQGVSPVWSPEAALIYRRTKPRHLRGGAWSGDKVEIAEGTKWL